MDVIRHTIKNEKQEKKMKNRILKKISLCAELFLANHGLCSDSEENLFSKNAQYCYKEKYKNSLDTKRNQELPLKYFCSNFAYTFNIISFNYNDAQIDICTLNVELNNYKINILAIINNVKPVHSFLLYSAKGNVEINNEDLLRKSLKFEKDMTNMYDTNKKYEINNSQLYNLNHITIIMKNIGFIFNNDCKMKIVNHMLFSVWLFQDIYMGYLLSVILKANYVNIFHVNKKNRFVIIRIHENSKLKLNFELFTFKINKIITSRIPAFKSHLPITVEAKYLELNATSRINTNCSLLNLKNKEFGKQDKSTYVVYKSPRTYFNECGINTEQTEYEMERDSQIDIINNNYFEFINSTLWLPYLCGDCFDDKIGNISYILKCSCLNESLLDLDNIERYIREIANILTSFKFYTTTLKDLSKYLAYIFVKL